MRYRRIPDETVRRLPVYLRGLMSISEGGGQQVSSKGLAALLSTNPWQIRKDFSYFGEFGKRGVGYDVGKLIKQIKKILKLDTGHKAALVGVGNLGAAILSYPGFRPYGFDISAVFDINPKKIGKKINKITIESVSKLGSLKRRGIDLGIISVPGEAAQDTAEALVKAGVKGILNFAPCYVTVPKRVKVITIDIALDLARLPYYM